MESLDEQMTDSNIVKEVLSNPLLIQLFLHQQKKKTN